MDTKMRLRFCKTGKAIYISHLDLMATMQRALLRAGISLKYSEGFNPHPYISIALPMPVGCASLCELMDFQPEQEISAAKLPDKLNTVLPEGIRIVEAYTPHRKSAEIAWLEVAGEWRYGERTQQAIADKLSTRFSADVIMIAKKTKRGEIYTDIAPLIHDITFSDETEVHMRARISAQNPTLNPAGLLGALTGEFADIAPDFTLFRRVEVYDRAMAVFR